MAIQTVTPIILDIDGGRSYDRQKTKQGNKNSRVFEITFMERGAFYEIPIGTTARIKALKPDKEEVYNDCPTPVNNKVLVTLTEQMQTAWGEMLCEVILTNSGDRLGSGTFPIFVEPSVHKGEVITSTIEYKSLENALDKVDTWGPQFDTLLNAEVATWEPQFQAKYTGLETEYATDLTQVKSDLATNTTQLDLKANETDINVRKSYYPPTGETSNIKKTYILPFNIENRVQVNKLAFEVTTNSAAVLYEFAIYDADYKIITRSGIKETFLGVNEVSLSPKILSVGKYYLAFICNSVSIKFKTSETPQALSSEYLFPLPTTLGNLYEENEGVYFELYSYDLKVPTGFSLTRDTTKRVFARGLLTSALYGWNTSTGKVCKSVTGGATWVDLMTVPAGGFWAMEIDETNGVIYTLNGSGGIFKSSGMLATDTFTEITDTTFKRPHATSLPGSMKLWQGYLWYGEYSKAPNELEGGAKVIRYNIATGVWQLSRQFVNCRHIHSFTMQSATVLYVSIGDAGWGVDIGYHRIINSGVVDGADVWVKWTKTGGENSLLYDVTAVVAPINGINVLLGATDQPGTLLSSTKITDTSVGNVNISHQCRSFVDSDPTETVRNVVLDSRLNCYFITQETTKPRLCVSPPPYTQAYILEDLPANVSMTSTVLSGENIFMSDYKMSCVNFNTVAKTVNARKYVYDKKEIDSLTYITSGAQGSKGVKNLDNLYIEATSNINATTQITSFYTNSQISTTGFKRLIVELDYFDCFGDSKASVSIGTSSDPNTFTQANTVIIPSKHTNGKLVLSIDLTTFQSVYNIHVKAIATGLLAQTKLKINRVYLSKNI